MFPTFRRWVATALLLAASATHLFGYALEGAVWPTGSTINVHLSFTGPSSGSLQDGLGTFNGSAANALALWNQQIELIKFGWTTGSVGGVDGDGQNSAFFSSTAYGMSFGDALASGSITKLARP